MLRCPTCGTKLDVVRAEQLLTPRQRQIRDAVEHVRRQTQRQTARSSDVAVHVELSQRTVQMELRMLKQMGILVTPNGPKSGYALKAETIALIPAVAA